LAVWYMFWQFGIYFGSLVYVLAIWYIFGNSLKYPHFGILCQEKSGNPGLHPSFSVCVFVCQ
jgi:hypothetical protein